MSTIKASNVTWNLEGTDPTTREPDVNPTEETAPVNDTLQTDKATGTGTPAVQERMNTSPATRPTGDAGETSVRTKTEGTAPTPNEPGVNTAHTQTNDVQEAKDSETDTTATQEKPNASTATTPMNNATPTETGTDLEITQKPTTANQNTGSTAVG